MNYRGGMWEGGGGQDGVEWGGKWDNCNSIINKILKNNNTKHDKKHLWSTCYYYIPYVFIFVVCFDLRTTGETAHQQTQYRVGPRMARQHKQGRKP